MIEQYYRFSTGTRSHRCRLCVTIYFDRYKVPPVDNGFVPLDKNPHIFTDEDNNSKGNLTALCGYTRFL
jgi:hypothetical protein